MVTRSLELRYGMVSHVTTLPYLLKHGNDVMLMLMVMTGNFH